MRKKDIKSRRTNHLIEEKKRDIDKILPVALIAVFILAISA
jgi:hypothetical protein